MQQQTSSIKKIIKCFQYAVKLVLNHEELNRDPQTITKIETFISKYNREGINLPSEKDDWKKFEKNNINVRNTIALNDLYVKK